MFADRVAKIALGAQGFVVARRFRDARAAASRKAIPERKPLAMRPELTLVRFSRNEIGTSHRVLSSPKPILSFANTARIVSSKNVETLKP